jgi:O-antigen/teichoic acid export membrane protein
MAITMFVSLYTTRVILDVLGTRDFGIFNVVAGAIAMLLFLNAAMTMSTQRFMSFAEGAGNKARLNDIFNVSVRLHLCIGLAVVALLECVGPFLFDGILRIDPERMHAARLIYQFMIVSTFFTIQSVPYDAVVNAHENMLFIALLSIVESLAKLGIALLLVRSDSDRLVQYGFFIALLAVLLFCVRVAFCRPNYPETRITLQRLSGTLFREMTGFAGWTFVGTMTSMLANYGQGIVLNVFFGTVVNAAQGVANQINGQVSVLSRSMLQAVNPIIAKSEGAGTRGMLVEATLISSKFSYLLVMITSLPIILEMDTIFSFWLKNIPPYAVVFTRLLLIRMLLEQLFAPLPTSISAVGNIRNFQIIQSATSLVAILISIPVFMMGASPTAIYFVFLAYAFVNAITSLHFASRLCGIAIPTFLTRVAWPAIATTVASLLPALIPYFLLGPGLFRVMMVVLVSLVSSLVSVLLIGMSSEERAFCAQTFHRLRSRLRSA